MYGSMAKKTEGHKGLLIITSVLIASKIRGTLVPQIKTVQRPIKDPLPAVNIIEMEELILQTLDFNLIVPLSIDFVHYLLGNNTKRITTFINNALLLFMTNYNWVITYGQYGLARTAVDLAMKHYKLTSKVCIRLLPRINTIPDLEINQFLVANWDKLTASPTYRMITNTLRSSTN